MIALLKIRSMTVANGPGIESQAVLLPRRSEDGESTADNTYTTSCYTTFGLVPDDHLVGMRGCVQIEEKGRNHHKQERLVPYALPYKVLIKDLVRFRLLLVGESALFLLLVYLTIAYPTR